MNIWLVSIFEQTPIDKVFSTRFISIANEAMSRGHDVTFFGSTFRHITKQQRFEETTEIDQEDSYRLVFVRSEAYYGNVSVKRLMAHHRLPREMIRAFEDRPRPDVILMAFPPISLAYEVSRWANEKEIPLLLDIIDPWPDIFELALPKKLRWLGAPLFNRMRAKVGAAFRNADHITAISNQYLAWAQTLAKEKINTSCFYPASDLEHIQKQVQQAPKQASPNAEEFVVIYAGSLAGSYDIPCILKAAEILEEKYSGKIKFKIAGIGPQQALIERFASEHDNLEYLGRLPKDELMQQYALSHLGLTQHIKGATQSVTYKLFDLLSAGLPILNSLESEMKDIIINEEVGMHNDPGDARQLAANIEDLYHNRSRLKEYRENGFRLTKEKGDTRVLYKNFVDLLEHRAQNSGKT